MARVSMHTTTKKKKKSYNFTQCCIRVTALTQKSMSLLDSSHVAVISCKSLVFGNSTTHK